MNLFQRAKQLLAGGSKLFPPREPLPAVPGVSTPETVTSPRLGPARFGQLLPLSNGLSRWDADLPGVREKDDWRKSWHRYGR